jgi:hypothetical protein
MLPEQNLDRVTEPCQRKRKERGRRPHTAARMKAAQLVRDHGHAASARHLRKRNVP